MQVCDSQAHVGFCAYLVHAVDDVVFVQKVKLKWYWWASLVAQWLRVCLLVQVTRVRALVWEDPTCRGAAGPVSHDH